MYPGDKLSESTRCARHSGQGQGSALGKPGLHCSQGVFIWSPTPSENRNASNSQESSFPVMHKLHNRAHSAGDGNAGFCPEGAKLLSPNSLLRKHPLAELKTSDTWTWFLQDTSYCLTGLARREYKEYKESQPLGAVAGVPGHCCWNRNETEEKKITVQMI